MAITRRNFVEAAGAAATIAALAACDTTTPETPSGNEGSTAEPEPQTEPEPEEPVDEGPKGHDLSEYPLDPDGDDVEALWSEEATKDGWTRVTNEGGKELGYWSDGGCAIIQVDGYAFKDLNGNGKLDAYEDWRLSVEDRSAELAKLMEPETILPMMYHGGTLNSSSAPLDDDTLLRLSQGARGGNTRNTPNDNNYIACIEWINAIEAACEADTANFGIPYLNSVDPYYVFDVPSCQGVATSFDMDMMKMSGDIMSKVWRANGIRCLLGPQIDLITQPTWTRGSGAITEDPALARDMANAYCSGLQSTWDEDGNDLGWGPESVASMIKHYFGAGAAEGGRNDHNSYAKYCAFPGDNLMAHLIPFIDGALHLDSVTGEAAAVMPNYGIAFTNDEHYGENVGGGFSKYKIDFLRVNAEYDGCITTDWGIAGTGGQGIRNWGREEYSAAENMAKIVDAGCDQFGGEWGVEQVNEAYKILQDEWGADEAAEIIRTAGRRIFAMMMKVDLFDNPYSDRTVAKAVFSDDKLKDESMEIQLASIAMIKNKGNLIKERGEGDKPKVYIPQKFVGSNPWAAMMGMTSEPAHWELPLDEDLANELFDLVTDEVLDPTGDDGEYTESDINRLTADDLKDIDFGLYFASAPDCRAEGYSGGKFVPISLQYGSYTADSEYVRKPSWGGDIWTEDSNFEKNPENGREDWSYKGATAVNGSADTLQAIKDTKELCGDAPLVLVLACNSQFCCHEFEDLCDGILLYFGDQVTGDAVCQIVAGKVEPKGLLIMQLPKDMEEVEKQMEDVPRDMECYEDSEGNVYDFGFGLDWSGVIDDERTQKYCVEPMTKPETIEV